MNLAMVKEAMEEMKRKNHPFTASEQEFVALFASKTGDRERMNQLMEEFLQAENDTESQQMIQMYSSQYTVKQPWVEQIERLLVSLERYHLEEERAMQGLADILEAYGIPTTVSEKEQ